MPAIKRSYDVANDHSDHVPTLHRIRNMWQFANLVQWIYIFGKAAKIDESIDVEVCYAKYSIRIKSRPNARFLDDRKRGAQRKLSNLARCCARSGQDGLVFSRHRVRCIRQPVTRLLTISATVPMVSTIN